MNRDLSNLLQFTPARDAIREALINASFETAKDEITCDVRNGVIPNTVESCSALHDHVDANMYGGNGLIMALFAGNDGTCGDDLEITNEVADMIDKWIKGGWLREVKPNSKKRPPGIGI